MPISAIRQVCHYAVQILQYRQYANMPLCRAYMPIFRYIGIIGTKMTVYMLICRCQQFDKYAVMPVRYADIGNTAYMTLCSADMPKYRYIGIIGKKSRCRYANMSTSAIRPVCRYVVQICRYIDIST